MARNPKRPRLEGLVLFDGEEFYELPCAVIERYRVPKRRSDELRADSPPGSDGVMPWLVHAGIYEYGKEELQ